QLTHLSLHGGQLSARGIAALGYGLGDRRLTRLELSGRPLPALLNEQLAEVCEELVSADVIAPEPVEPWVEHANKPEWGRGRIVRRFDGKVEVAFPRAGIKVFKADAPFLRIGS